MRRGRPYMRAPIGNPARVLLKVDDERIQVRPCCPFENERCIEPGHYKVIVETPFKYDDAPRPIWSDPRNTSPFSDRELEEINENVELLTANEIMEDDLGIFPEHIRDEILKRARATT